MGDRDTDYYRGRVQHDADSLTAGCCFIVALIPILFVCLTLWTIFK